ncbi:hypothetical protein RISK_005424 [Rhodopirellula islandica]|uniref:Uncharacterized protein n=1 Tax=Rhodopirellula islandica TaxID=595434 RepID=A0A0J1B6Z2_RHOIS|nr:hypothetical protein RISK_005424 [Rhodopirellula islandica]
MNAKRLTGFDPIILAYLLKSTGCKSLSSKTDQPGTGF